MPEWKKALSSLERINIYSKNCSINCIQNAIHSYNRLSLFVFSLIKKELMSMSECKYFEKFTSKVANENFNK